MDAQGYQHNMILQTKSWRCQLKEFWHEKTHKSCTTFGKSITTRQWTTPTPWQGNSGACVSFPTPFHFPCRSNIQNAASHWLNLVKFHHFIGLTETSSITSLAPLSQVPSLHWLHWVKFYHFTGSTRIKSATSFLRISTCFAHDWRNPEQIQRCLLMASSSGSSSLAERLVSQQSLPCTTAMTEAWVKSTQAGAQLQNSP